MNEFQEIVTAVAKKEIVLFLGAGVHYHAPEPPEPPVRWIYPRTVRPRMAAELAAQLAQQSGWSQRFDSAKYPPETNFTRVTLDYELFIEEDMVSPPGIQNPLRLASHRATALREQGRTRLNTQVNLAVQGNTVTSPIVKALAELGFPIVVTTNYDQHYENAARTHGANPTVKWYHPKLTGKENDFRHGDPSSANPFIFKIHGDITDASSLVITDEDYIDFVMRMTEAKNTNPVPQTITYRMSRWPTLFIGYSLMDYNLRLLLKTLHYNKDFPDQSCSVSPYPDPLITRVWQDEHQSVSFISEDVWNFVPRLYQAITGNPMPQ